MSPIHTELVELFISGAVALLLLWAAKKGRFWVVPSETPPWRPPLSWFHVAIAFSLYFFLSFLISGLVRGAMMDSPVDGVKIIAWGNFLLSSSIFLSLLAFFLIAPGISLLSIACKGPFKPALDVGIAVLTYLISFPLIVFVSEFFDVLLYFFFKTVEMPDQNAVYFLRLTMNQPLYYFLAVTAIIVLAPLIEETLFRGLLQTAVRRLFGVKTAILTSSTLFALFHFSIHQGLSNIPILASLFVLALFLGYLYERQQSLLAPMSLHALFNAVSVISLTFS